MIEKILKYPRGEKKRNRLDHKNLINKYAVSFGIDTNDKLLWFYTLIFAVNGKTLKPKATTLRIDLNAFIARYGTSVPYTTNQRQLSNIIYGGCMGNYLSQDGFNYRPKGFLRVNGRNNYSLVDKECRKRIGYHFGVEENPRNLMITSISLICAMAYYSLKCGGCESFRDVVYAFDGNIFNLEYKEKILRGLVV